MKEVLIITYHFPPRPTIGSVRMRGLAKYLPEFGWHPIILTPALPGDPEPGVEIVQTPFIDIVRRWKNRLGLDPDEMLRQQIGPTSSSKRGKLRGRFVKYIAKMAVDCVAYPDIEKEWYRFACAAGNELMQQRNICAVISSSPPATCHLIAKDIKTRWNIPWIGDLRDPWTQTTLIPSNHTFLRRVIERKLESRTFFQVDVLAAVSVPLAQALRELYVGKPVYEILNGFDLEGAEYALPARLTDEFTITSTGSLYDCLRNPSDLFVAIKELISEGFMDPSRVQIRFYGRPEICLERLIEHHKLRQIAKCYGVVPREVALEKQRESQLLLLLNWDSRSTLKTCTPPAKLFEYFAARRPVLSMGKTGGGIEELLSMTNTGIHASTVDHIKSFLKQCYSEYKSGGEVIYRGWKTEVDKHNQREMAGKFSEILGSLA